MAEGGGSTCGDTKLAVTLLHEIFYAPASLTLNPATNALGSGLLHEEGLHLLDGRPATGQHVLQG